LERNIGRNLLRVLRRLFLLNNEHGPIGHRDEETVFAFFPKGPGADEPLLTLAPRRRIIRQELAGLGIAVFLGDNPDVKLAACLGNPEHPLT
jgi:hypothetical protein